MSTANVSVEERYAVFPFYLCLDVSASMAGAPLDSVNQQLPLLRASIGEDPAIAEVIRFGVITFSDVATTLLPLCDLSLVEAVPELTPQGRTSYAAAFHHLRTGHRDRLPRQPVGRRPVVPPGRHLHLRRPARPTIPSGGRPPTGA